MPWKKVDKLPISGKSIDGLFGFQLRQILPRSLFFCRKQVAASQADAERDGVVVPTTMEEYCMKAKPPQSPQVSWRLPVRPLMAPRPGWSKYLLLPVAYP